MKKLLIIITVCLTLGIVNSQAQIQYGFKAGLNIASTNFKANYESDFGSILGYYAGPFATIRLIDSLSIQPQLLISRQGYYYNHPSIDGKAKFFNTYLNIPIMIRYRVIDQLSLEAGPQAGFLLGTKSKIENETTKRDLFKSVDFGFNIGATYHTLLGFSAELRYNLGLINIDKDLSEGVQSLTNRVFSIGISYAIQ